MVVVATIAGACAFGLFGVVHLRADAERRKDPASVESPARVRSGTELVAVFITSSKCGASRIPTLPATIANIHQGLLEQARREGKNVVWVGISLDDDPTAGFEFLKTFGAFDEVVVGGNWLNGGALHFMVRDLTGPLITPQLVLVEREVTALPTTLTVSPDRLIIRKSGADRIQSFALEFSRQGTK